MSFYKVDTSSAAKADYSGGGSVLKTGMYGAVIKYVSYKKTDGGAGQVGIAVKTDSGAEGTLYLTLFNKNGEKNEINGAKFDALLTVCGIENLEPPEPRTVKIGDKDVDLLVFPELDEQPISIGVRTVFSKYDGFVRESQDLVNVFHPDNYKSASELLNEVEEAKQYYKLEDTLKDKYDGVTEDEVAAWIAAGRPRPEKKGPPQKPQTSGKQQPKTPAPATQTATTGAATTGGARPNPFKKS